MKKIYIKHSPAKFSSGISSLWRGNDLKLLNSFLFRNEKYINTVHENTLLFESARSAITNALLSCGIGLGDEVIVSSFTCDAVSYAVMQSGAKVVYIDINPDLTMDESALESAITKYTRAVIVQDTFGKIGLHPSKIKALKKKGYLIIEDCCLAFGSRLDSKKIGDYGDISIWSLEVSKTITIGWGGVLKINNNNLIKSIRNRYFNLKQVGFISDIRRLTQLWVSLYFIKRPFSMGVYLWYFLYGTKIFRRSESHHKKISSQAVMMGEISKKLFNYMTSKFESIFDKTNSNFIEIYLEIERLGLNCPIIQNEGEFLVTPRIPILVSKNNIEEIIKITKKNKIEVVRWFSQSPPQYKIENTVVSSFDQAFKISECIIGFSCHWTLDSAEILKIKKCLNEIKIFEKSVFSHL